METNSLRFQTPFTPVSFEALQAPDSPLKQHNVSLRVGNSEPLSDFSEAGIDKFIADNAEALAGQELDPEEVKVFVQRLSEQVQASPEQLKNLNFDLSDPELGLYKGDDVTKSDFEGTELSFQFKTEMRNIASSGMEPNELNFANFTQNSVTARKEAERATALQGTQDDSAEVNDAVEPTGEVNDAVEPTGEVNETGGPTGVEQSNAAARPETAETVAFDPSTQVENFQQELQMNGQAVPNADGGNMTLEDFSKLDAKAQYDLLMSMTEPGPAMDDQLIKMMRVMSPARRTEMRSLAMQEVKAYETKYGAQEIKTTAYKGPASQTAAAGAGVAGPSEAETARYKQAQRLLDLMNKLDADPNLGYATFQGAETPAQIEEQPVQVEPNTSVDPEPLPVVQNEAADSEVQVEAATTGVQQVEETPEQPRLEPLETLPEPEESADIEESEPLPEPEALEEPEEVETPWTEDALLRDKFDALSEAQQAEFRALYDNEALASSQDKLGELLKNGQLLTQDSRGNTAMSHLTRLMNGPLQNGVRRNELAADAIDVLSDRNVITQGRRGTSGAASLEYVMAGRQPAELLRVVTDLASSGQSQMQNNGTLKADESAFDLYAGASHNGISETRSDFDILFQSAVMESVAQTGGDLGMLSGIAEYDVRNDTRSTTAALTGDSGSDPGYLASMTTQMSGQTTESVGGTFTRASTIFSSIERAVNQGQEVMAVIDTPGSGFMPYVVVDRIDESGGQVFYTDLFNGNHQRSASIDEFKSMLQYALPGK